MTFKKLLWLGLASRPWLVVPLAAAIHATYGIGLFAGYDVSHVTAVYLIYQGMSWIGLGFATAWLMLGVAVLSITPMVFKMRTDSMHLCLWPQQMLLFGMAASTLLASSHGYYPDGTLKNGVYIYIDQAWAVYLALAHFAATLRNALGF